MRKEKNMNLKRFLALALALVMVLILGACGEEPAVETVAPSADAEDPVDAGNIFEDPDAPVFNFRAYCSAPDSAVNGAGAKYLCDIIRERSNGKIDYEYFGNAILGGERDMIESLQIGDLDMMVGGPVLANFSPSFEIMNMPFLFNSREHAYSALDGDFGAAVFEDVKEEAGIIGLGWFDNGFYDVMNGKYPEVTGYEQFAGLNIRTVESAGYQAGWIAVGANPVAMAVSEVYTSVQNGTVDGICLGITGTHSMGLHEAGQVNYCTLYMYYGALPILVSESSWNEMPEEYRELVVECVADAVEYERGLAMDYESGAIEDFEEAGCHYQVLDEAAREEWKEYVTGIVYPEFSDIITQDKLDLLAKYDT